MGIDAVEIVIDVEERFGITIRDDEAQSILTVGDLLALINARIAGAQHAHCPSLSAFLRVRQLMREFLRQPDLRLRPSDLIASVVPIRRRHELWRTLTKLFGTAAPALRRPAPLRYALVGISCVAVAIGLATALIDVTILPLGLLSAAALIIVLQLVTTPLRIVPPANFSTFGHISRRLVGLSMATQPALGKADVLESVRSILVQNLGIDPEEVVPEARLVKDLGMG